jgi:hypothetical protein
MRAAWTRYGKAAVVCLLIWCAAWLQDALVPATGRTHWRWGGISWIARYGLVLIGVALLADILIDSLRLVWTRWRKRGQ